MSDDAVVSGIVQADQLQTYVNTLQTLVDECKLHFGDGGLRAKLVDPANVGMLEASLKRGAFESFDSPGQVVHGVNLQRFDELLGKADSDDLVEFGVNMETRKLELRYRGIEHHMALIDPDSVRQEPDMPDLDLPNHVVMRGELFAEALEACDLTSDHLFLRGRSNGDERIVEFAAQGDVDETTVQYGEGDCIRFDVDRETESVYSLDYLKDMKAEIPDSSGVAVHFGDEFPVIFDYTAFDGDLEAVGVLAPRIQSN